MENSRPPTTGFGKTAGGRSKTPGLPASTRLQRNLAEKERRDKLNGFISELATLVPMVSNASKPLDKVSILRLAAAEMRLHFSCLNPKKYKKKPLVLPPAVISSLDLIEKTIGGFIVVTTLTGLIVFCSRSIEDYLGYQNIDVMGNKVIKYIYEDDIKYFESQVNSVVKSLKRKHKKTKVIKAHMLQKPLPRSSETCRPRNMIFKISVHQNDMGDNGCNNNGGNNLSPSTKNRPQKDFGYSAVVLMFIEPVRFEPEIDITYIDSNQDVYFTRHGLQGEIIYADQRISTITGYMPHDVQGTSAYQYICSSDVPIALFAQKAMFTSTDGKGIIVYRLRIRDMRCIYLQSSGQIVYKESSNEISHFVCFNRLLSEEEGSQELKKFQQRYAPQIMEAKMLQVKQNPGSTSPTTDLAFEQVMKLLNVPPVANAASTSAQTGSVISTISSPQTTPVTTDQKPSEIVGCPSTFPIQPNFVHSSEGHSSTSLVNCNLSDSVALNSTPLISENQVDTILERPEQRLGGGPIRRTDCSSTLLPSPYKMITNDRKGKVFSPEQCRNSKNKLDSAVFNDQVCYSGNNLNTNGTYQTHQNGQYVSIKSQNRTVQFVNVNNNLFDCGNLNDNNAIYGNQSMAFDPALSEKLTFQITTPSPSFNDQMSSSMTDVSRQLDEYLGCEEQLSRNKSQMPALAETNASVLCDQLNIQNPESQVPQFDNMTDLPEIYDASTAPSLLKNSNILLSDVYDDVDYCHNFNSNPEMDSYNNYHMPNNINSYSNGANVDAYNGVDLFDSKLFSFTEMNGFDEGIKSLNEVKTIPPVETFHSINTSSDVNALIGITQNFVQNKDFMDTNVSESVNVKRISNINQNGTQSAFSNFDELELSASTDWNEFSSHSSENEEAPLNKELYSELESFFINLQKRNNSEAAVKNISEAPCGNSCYSQKTISSEIKRIYQH